jgi:hypothetical protein
MPTYLYSCPISNEEFEEFHSIMTKLEHCPLCEKAGRVDHAPDRLISGGSGRGIVELTGQDLIDKTKADGAAFKKQVYSDANTYANILGDSKYQSIQQGLDRGKRNRG